MKYLNIFVIFSMIFFTQTSLAAHKTLFAKTSNLQTRLKISQIKSRKMKEEILVTQGYIAKIYVCPPCPPNVYCKPCMGNNIVISESNKSLDNYILSEKELIIFTKDTNKLTKGKKYSFKIKITRRRSTGEPINDIEMISYKIMN